MLNDNQGYMIMLKVCVDSSATLSLLSLEGYENVKHTGCEDPIQAIKQKLRGVSGQNLCLAGWLDSSLRVVLQGELSGEDLLLGLVSHEFIMAL